MDSDLDPRFNPVFQRGHEDDPLPVSRVDPAPVIERSRDLPPATPGRNPWLPTLWALSITILALGIWAQWYSQKLMTSPNIDNVQDYYVWPSVLSSLAPWFVVVGLASLVGVVFLHAVRWRER